MTKFEFKQLSEHALFVQFGTGINEQTQQQIAYAMTALQQRTFPGLVEIVPSYTNLCVYYDPSIILKKLPPATTISEYVQQMITSILNTFNETGELTRRTIEIPVIYGGIYGPDLQEVADYHQLTPDEVIQIHSSSDYLVYMLGFAPGFPYLGGLDARLITPRRATPRLEIAAGSVGIGGEQTGIYPFATPGGWQIIGRTLKPLFSLENNPPTLLQAGDLVRFVAVKEDALC